MVGNVREWVGDWNELATSCSVWSAPFGSDIVCVGGDQAFGYVPGVPLRGGHYFDGTYAGVFAIGADDDWDLTHSFNIVGFRCAR